MTMGAPGLYWPIKRGFVMYVARLADGEILGGPGIRMADPSTFVWPWAEGDSASLTFGSEVRFRAHEGALSFRVAEPRVELGEGRATLTIVDAAGRTPMVTFDASPDDITPGHRGWRGTDVRLTEEAIPLFAGYYGADEQFDDLVIVGPAV